ncbi:MAG: Rieske 2Fe-2S domain-containing protein [Spirochaetales bacterium]|nr:Rieske 2Fe-2S domain-containing protein [Spirochaetales bacterium]
MKVTVCKEYELSERPLVVETDFGRIAVLRKDGEVLAFEDVCTHDDGPLAEGEIEGDSIVCPRHGASFDMKKGTALRMPATEGIATFTAVIRDGQVEVEID